MNITNNFYGLIQKRFNRFTGKGTIGIEVPNKNMVINGNEIGGGSIRIHDQKLQEEVFSILGFSKKEAFDQFGFLLEAFTYGAPPHGGIAFGLDKVLFLASKSPP